MITNTHLCVYPCTGMLLVKHERSPIHLFCVFHLLYMCIDTGIQMENYDQLTSIVEENLIAEII